MARGKDDDQNPQSDRDRRVLTQDQAPLSTELREAGLDHRARGEREAGGAAWEATAEKALHDRAQREQTGRDVAGQDQRGRPDVELDQQQPAKEQRETQQREQLERQERVAEAQRIRQEADQQSRQAQQEHAYETAQAQGRAARGRAADSRAERDQRYANADYSRESAQDDAQEAHDLNRGAEGRDDPEAVADQHRAQALMADHDRKRSVAARDEDRGRAEDARLSRATAEARGHESVPPPEQAKAERGPNPSDGSQPPANQIKRPRRTPRARRGGKSATAARTRDRGRERRA